MFTTPQGGTVHSCKENSPSNHGYQLTTGSLTKADSISSFQSCASCPALHVSAHVTSDEVTASVQGTSTLGQRLMPHTSPKAVVLSSQISQTSVQSQSPSIGGHNPDQSSLQTSAMALPSLFSLHYPQPITSQGQHSVPQE